MKTYKASQKNNVTNWKFEGTLEDIAQCLQADGKAQIIEITQEMIDSEDSDWGVDQPGLYFTPNCESWELERAGDIGSEELNILGRTPMESAVYEILSHDMHSANLEEVA